MDRTRSLGVVVTPRPFVRPRSPSTSTLWRSAESVTRPWEIPPGSGPTARSSFQLLRLEAALMSRFDLMSLFLSRVVNTGHCTLISAFLRWDEL